MNIDKKDALSKFEVSKHKGTYEIKGFTGVTFRVGAAHKGSGYEYYFASDRFSREITIPDEIDGLPVTKVAVKFIPDDAIVFCSGQLFAKLPRGAKASTARVWLEDPSRFKADETEQIKAFVKKYGEDAAAALSGSNSVEAFARFFELVKAKPEIIERLLHGAEGNPEITAILLERSSKRPADAPTLDAPKKVSITEFKKLWTYREYTDGNTGEQFIELTNYKGTDEHVHIPSMLGNKPIRSVIGDFPSHVTSVEFDNTDIKLGCSFRNCKAMTDENGFVVVQVGDRSVLTDYTGPQDLDKLCIPNYITENTFASFRKMDFREVAIPESFRFLANWSFADCARLQRVTIAEGLRSIGDLAFKDCASLQQVTLPESLTALGASVFSGCQMLKQLFIPSGVTKIGGVDVATTIYAPAGSYAIEYAKENDVPYMESEADSVPAVETTDFAIENNVMLRYVGSQTDVMIPDGVAEIAGNAFKGRMVVSVSMPESVKRIGDFAFHECRELKRIRFSDNLESIGEYAFCSCSSLEEITLPDRLQRVGSCAFEWCSKLRHISIPCSAVVLEEDAFFDCRDLERVDLSSGVTEIGKDAFSKIMNFVDLTIHAPAGSYAEQYAKEHGIPFVEE